MLSIRSSWKYMKLMLRSIDIFGRKTELSMNKEPSYKTTFGGILSLIMIIVWVLFFVGFGNDMVNRLNPTLIFSEIYQKEPSRTYFSRNGFFFMFGVELPNFTHFIDESVYTVTVMHRKYSSDNQTTFNNEVEIERCSDDKMPNNQNLKEYFLKASQSPVENLFCLRNPENYYLEGAFDANAYIFLEITISTCSNSSSSSLKNNITCRPEADIAPMMEGFFALYTMDYLINPSNYEIPGDSVGKDYFTPLSVGIKRYTNRYIATTQIQTDDGILFSNQRVSHVYPTYQEDKETLLMDNSKEGVLMDFIFRKHHSDMVYDRSYKKIQDVLAEIGGFTQIIYMFFFAMSYPIISKKYYEKIINMIYNFEGGNEQEATHLQKKSLARLEESLKDGGSKILSSYKTMTPNMIKLSEKKSSLKMKKDTEKTREAFMKYMLKLRNRPPLKTTYWEYLSNSMNPCNPRESSNERIRRLKAGEKMITEKTDIAYILKKFYEIDKIKMILFNPNQYHLFEYLPKPTILKNSKVDLGNSKNTKFVTYETNEYGQAKKLYMAYRNIKSQNELSQLDKKLIEMLDDNLKGILDVAHIIFSHLIFIARNKTKISSEPSFFIKLRT